MKIKVCCLLTVLSYAAPTQTAVAATCTANSTTISISCQNLEITTPGVTVTINPGVTVSAPGGTGIGLWNRAGATSTSIINNGTLSASGEMIFNQGTIQNLINYGTIGGGFHIYNTSTIGVLTNAGTIAATFRGIYNTGTLNTLNNGQGGTSPFVMTNSNLPTFYNIIINGTPASGNYGKLSAPSNGGAMTFNIYGNTGTTLVSGVPASLVSAGTYSSVLTGINAANLANVSGGKVSGTYGIYTWFLEPQSTPTIWDLVVAIPVLPPSPTAAVTGTGFTQGAGAAAVLNDIIATAPGGDMGAVVTALGTLTTNQQVADAVKQTLPVFAGGLTQATGSALSSINRVVQARIDNNRGRSSGDSFLGNNRFWLKPFSSNADQKDRNGVSGFKADTAGIAFGADGTLSNETRLGAALVYAHSKVDGKDSLTTPQASVDVYSLVVYGSRSLDEQTDISFQADAGKNANQTNRSINFGGLDRIARADYTSTTAHAGIGIGRAMPLSERSTFTPSVRADYTAIRDRAYTESGAGALNLNVQAQTTDEFVVGVHGGLTHILDSRAALSANLGVGYDMLAERGSMVAAFAGSPGASFSTQGMDAAPWTMRGGLGYSYKISDTTEITARYDVEARSKFTNQTVSLKARWAF